MDIFATIFAGLGLFFIGIKLIGGNLKQMGGRRFRTIVAKAVSNRLSAAGLGILAGALTQSTNAVTFISINTVTAGLVTVRQVLPIILWANVGTSALVILATLNIHLLVMLLIGVVGLLYYFEADKSARFRHLIGALLGIGLLFLGLDLIRESAAAMRDIDAVQTALRHASESYLLAFVVGIVITTAAQSSATVTMVAVAMAEAGLLTFDLTMMIVYGAGVGSGLAVWLMAAALRGAARQLAVLQTVTKCTGALVLVPAFFLGHVMDRPLIVTVLDTITPHVHEKIAWLYLLYQLVSVLIVSVVLGPLFGLIERRHPESAEASLSRPRFIYAGGDQEAETALLLVEREQRRLVGYARDSLDWVREESLANRPAMVRPQVLHQAAREVGGEVTRFLGDLMDTAPQHETMARLAAMNTAQDLLDRLADEVSRLVLHIDAAEPPPALRPVFSSMVEGLHLVILILVDEMESSDPFQRESLLAMTADRSEMMDGMRRELMRGDHALSTAEQGRLFSVSAAFEHSIWLVRRYVTLLDAV